MKYFKFFILILLTASLAFSQEFPGSVKNYKPKQALNGFTIYPVRKSEVLLVNMAGKVLNKWNLKVVRAKLLKNCNLLVVHDEKNLYKKVREYSWDGKVEWEYKAPGIVHHDIVRLDNGNTLFPYKNILRYSLNPQDQNSLKGKLRSDVVLEISPKGEKVWEWAADKHLDIYSCGLRGCGKTKPNSKHWLNKFRDWSHINTTRLIPPNKWYDKGDERFKPGNVITLPRNLWTPIIVDRDTKEVVWKYAGDYKGGVRFPHESHMIPVGYPGAGNILIFDNGRKKRGSFALEVNPVTKKVVWVYEDGMNFASTAHGALQRLKNGNTLISEDGRGRVFEVTPNKEIVWEFRINASLRRASRYEPNFCPKLKDLPLS